MIASRPRQAPPDRHVCTRNPLIQPHNRMTSCIVIDTNIALDLLVFADPACVPLQAALDAGELRWLATAAMRDELARVLGYPQIVPRLAHFGRTPEAVLADFDRQVQQAEPAPRATVVCKDPDDQIFIDLAVAHRALLLSKDRAVLTMKKRLAGLGTVVSPVMAPADLCDI